MKKIDFIGRHFEVTREKIKVSNFSEENFKAASGFSIESLINKSRKKKVCEWRHVGIVFLALKTNSVTKATEPFGRDHSNFYNSFARVSEALEGYNPMILFKIRLLEAFCEKNVLPVVKEDISLENCTSFVKEFKKSGQFNHRLGLSIYKLIKEHEGLDLQSFRNRKKLRFLNAKT